MPSHKYPIKNLSDTVELNAGRIIFLANKIASTKQEAMLNNYFNRLTQVISKHKELLVELAELKRQRCIKNLNDVVC